ncbi:unnamed protein product [Clonostachys chloroleuca]|uniref:DNA repair protein RAD16 n=1 Tax=Clonostachys chloroleuca TaxID=1926264 RepID=A0AA35PZA5_9HYPO|nr:unnamed protein product [Clonostachys chloroleuca]
MEGRIYITIDDEDDDGDSHRGSSTFAPRVAREKEPSLFDCLGDRYKYSDPNVKLEPQETPMETIFERAPDTENKGREEPQAPLGEDNPTGRVDQAMSDSGIQDQEKSQNLDEEDTSKDEVDQTMSDIETESHDEPEVLPSEEPLEEQPDQAMSDTAAEGLGESPRLVEEDLSKEPVNYAIPDIGTHDQGEPEGPVDEESLFFQDEEGEVDAEIEQELPSNTTLEDNQAADSFDEGPTSPQVGDRATNFGHKVSTSGQFKFAGDLSDSEEEQNDEQEDMAENLGSEDPDEDDGRRGDEGAEDYEEHFGGGFDQDFGEDQELEEAQPVDEEVEGDDQDPDHRENSGQRPDEGDDGSEYEDTDSEEDSDNESANATKTPASDAKVPRVKKAKSKNKDPTTAKFAPTAREFFRRKNMAAEAKKAGVKRKAETQKSAPPKRKKSANQTGWRDNEPCMRLAKKFLATEDLPNAASQGSLPSFGSIKATTQADQFAQIKAKLPKHGDTRRMASQEKDLKMAVKSFGYKRMLANDGDWTHKDMETSLFSYQVTITSWMIERECSGSSPLGGLIGDEMGMGKTLVSIACAVGHPPEAEDIEKFCKATLVIVPNKMIARQWVEEIRKHCKEHIRNLACIYRFGDESGLDFYREKFFVLATYRDIMHGYPGIAKVQEWKEKYEDDKVSFNREFSKAAGDIFKIDWYRIILDEAHQIKNVKAHTSIACCDLSSRFRWCLSGTPLSNTPQEFFPYLKFLGCPFTDSSLNFHAKFVDGFRGKENFDALVGLVMYRRTKKDSFLGHKILNLPGMHSEDLWVSITQEEQDIYDTVFEHYDKAIRQLKAKEQEKGLTETEKDALSQLYLAQSTRLRQTVSHIFGIERLFRESIKDVELESLMEILNSRPKKAKLIDNLKHQEGVAGYSLGLKKLEGQKANVFGGSFALTNFLRMSRNEIKARSKSGRCLICNKDDMPKEPMKSYPCGHIYCMKCLCDLVYAEREHGIKCLHASCTQPLTVGNAVEIFDGIITKAKEDKDYKEPGEDSVGARIARKKEANGFFTATSLKPKLFEIPPSTKLTAALSVILTWQENHPDDKILVFTQFVMSGKILGYMLSQLGMQFLYLYGSIDDRGRKKAIKAFKEEQEKKIMIIGLKCGGQALNLTAANRVILIDPWWNNVQENQAFGRVWRHGQTKETHLVRIWANVPVDHYIFKLQNDKAIAVDYALQDDNHKPAVLDDGRLQKLFAPIQRVKPKVAKQKKK